MMYQLSVVGAGPVGLTLLCAMGCTKFFTQNEKLFSLVDASKHIQKLGNIPSQRVVSVSNSSERILRSVGAWDHLMDDRIMAYDSMQVWESHGSGYLQFQEQQLGHIVEYDNIVQALLKVIVAQNKTQIYQPNQLKDFKSQQGEYLNITLDDDVEFQTKLLVGSDGNHSKVKEIAKIGSYGWAYNQIGVVCTVQSDRIGSKAYQKFLKNGLPLALLPMRDGKFTIVWTVSKEDSTYLMKLNEKELVDEINNALVSKGNESGFESPPLIQNILNERLSFPLQTLQSTRYVGGRIALIGDAAHSIHPLAGQGMNMGMNDAAILANTIIRNLRAGNDIGCAQALDEYESASKLMNYTTSLGMEAIKRIYESNDYAGFVGLRNMGASIINNCDPIKKALQSHAAQHFLAPNELQWEI